jgi:hypothetical protein
METRLRFSPYIKDVMVLGDRSRPFVGALVQIDGEMVGRWAEQRTIGYSTFTDLSQKEEVRGLVRDEIEKVNRLLPEPSRLQRFANFPKELDPDEGELTRTRKLRREFLEERYGPLIEGIYESARGNVPVDHVERVGGGERVGHLGADVRHAPGLERQGEQVAEVLAHEQLHHHEDAAARILDDATQAMAAGSRASCSGAKPVLPFDQRP